MRSDEAEAAEATKRLLHDYQDDFARELATFERQPGIRVEVALSPRNLRRARSTAGRRFVLDGGERTVTFFIAAPSSLRIDGSAVAPTQAVKTGTGVVELGTDDAHFKSTAPAEFTIDRTRIRIRVAR